MLYRKSALGFIPRMKAPDQCCVSDMFIPDPGSPDFYPSRIPDPTTETKRVGGKNCCFSFCCLKLFYFRNRQRKKFEPVEKELDYFLPKNWQ
jgi:hypothetical protein